MSTHSKCLSTSSQYVNTKSLQTQKHGLKIRIDVQTLSRYIPTAEIGQYYELEQNYSSCQILAILLHDGIFIPTLRSCHYYGLVLSTTVVTVFDSILGFKMANFKPMDSNDFWGTSPSKFAKLDQITQLPWLRTLWTT